MESAMSIVILILMAGMIYFLMIRPQQKRMREQMELMKSLQPGEDVMTSSGIYGTIAEVEEDTVLLEVAEDVQIRIAKNAVVRVVPEAGEEPEESEDLEEAEAGEEPEENEDLEEAEAGEEPEEGGEPGEAGGAPNNGKRKKK